MSLKFEDFIQSPQFTFFVGQDGKPIVVHAAAIAATSEQLDALINGGMEESETRCAKIEDVRVDDFIRFCEYAYRGDYTVPPWEEAEVQSIPVPGTSQQRDDDEYDEWGANFAQTSKKKKGKKTRAVIEEEAVIYDVPVPVPAEPAYEVTPISRSPLRIRFNKRDYIGDIGPKALISRQSEPKSNSGANQNFTPVLLAHARLYCFAHLRLIAPLKALTLDKIHKTLLNFKLYTERIGDIIELARYAYTNEHLPDRNDDGSLDDLKRLVVEYIVCEIDTIGWRDEFVGLLEEGGEFAGDFWREVRNYVV